MNSFVSWSGGKDCCLALYRALLNGHNIRYLFSMINKETGRLWPHNLSPEVLKMQAHALGIPTIQRWTTSKSYKTDYMESLRELKRMGIEGGVFGDVSVGNELSEKHRNWVDEVCQPIGITPYRPLWDQTKESLIADLVESGFEIVIIAADNRTGMDWLGRKLDKEALSELRKRHELSPTGEVGYYHTFVLDGPIFKNRLEITETSLFFKKPYWFLDIEKCVPELKSKKVMVSSLD
jgi:uncharacterized protein (TIGR00290 family)